MSTIIFYLILFTLIYLPFQPFLVTWTNWSFISILRDLLVVAIFACGLVERIRQKKPLVADNLEWILTLFLIWNIFSSVFIGHNLPALVYSLRYSSEIFILFWSVRLFDFNQQKQQILLKTIFGVFLLIFISGVLQSQILPKDFLLKFGYSSSVAIGSGIWTVGAKLPAAQIIPGGVVRAQSTLSGPIQLAAYLLVILGLAISCLRYHKFRQTTWTILIAGLILLILTFTRSAWIGAAVISIGYLILKIRQNNQSKIQFNNKIIIPLFLGFFILIFTLSASYLFSPTFKDLIDSSILRPSSSAEHRSSVQRIWHEIPQIGFLGRGVGKSGPASFRIYSSNPRAVENSYLRIYEELGFIGLFIFIWLILAIIKRALMIKNTDRSDLTDIFRLVAGLAVLGIAIAALFSDTWTEAIPTLILGLIVGLGLTFDRQQLIDKQPRLVKIFDIPISSLNLKATLEKVDQLIQSPKPNQICTVNAEFLVESQKNNRFKQILQSSDLNTADGSGVIAAAEYLKTEDRGQRTKIRNQKSVWAIFYFLFSIFSFLFGLLTGFRLILAPRSFETIPERVTGADLSAALCQLSAQKNYRIFFLGGDNNPKTTRQKLIERWSDLKIAGVEYGGQITKDGISDDLNLVERISSSKADILLVGFGSPRQEFFINRFKDRLNIPVMIGVGGSIDFLISLQRRAPKIWQKFSLEWLWRLITNLSDSTRRRRIYNAVIKFPWLVYESSIKKSP